MNNIHEIIQKEVLAKGVISFAHFMDLALYCPKSGYYERPDVSPGKKGDFYTSVSVGPLFGELLAFQFSEWLRPLDATNCQIVEAGAHNGQLAHDVLLGMKEQAPGFLENLEYWIVEPSAERKEWQAKTLGDLARYVRWYNSWEDTPKSGVSGVIFSNELLDAMPVHRIGWGAREKKWFEWGVSLNEGRFVWTRMPESSLVSSEELLRLPQELTAVLPDQFTTELCPAALDWWRLAAGKLRAGKLLAMDYGLTADQFFIPARRNGTLRAYFRHHLVEDLLANVGEQDLTAHVNFTQVQKAGELEGLQTVAFQSQAQFLTRIAAKIFKMQKDSTAWSSAKVRQFQTLTHPEHLGQSFRVLLQSRGPA